MIAFENAPDHVLALRAVGKLTREDIKAAVAAVDAKLARHRQIGIVADITGLSGITFEGLLEDLRAEFRYVGAWVRFPKLSLIAADGFLKSAALFVDRLIPQVEMRAFQPGEWSEAIAFAASADGLTAHT